MTRLPETSARAFLFATCALVIGVVAPALAATVTPRVVMDSAPYAVAYRGEATVKGHLNGDAPNEEVSLQQRLPGGEIKTFMVRKTDENKRVEFRLHDLKRTKIVRLKWSDDVTNAADHSRWRTVRVTPRLTMNLRPHNAFQGTTIRMKGRLLPVAPDRKVVVKKKVKGNWQRLKTVPVRRGRYSTRVPAGDSGHSRYKVKFVGDRLNDDRQSTGRVRVYDPDPATWYGPGFWGNGTACGQTLKRGTLGVAHRTLPCGTMVSIVFQGRAITVPVIDRGPYTSAEWDLTQATAERIGFSGSQTVGTLREN